MKRDAIDFFQVEEPHLVMHDRLTNWARYVQGRGAAWQQAAIWRLGKSNGRQWHEPDMRPPVDTLDGHAIEKAVAALPELHRDALRWYYVKPIRWDSMCRALGVTKEGLMRLVVDGRRMLINRRV